jgi:hypothetical protein
MLIFCHFYEEQYDGLGNSNWDEELALPSWLFSLHLNSHRLHGKRWRHVRQWLERKVMLLRLTC